MNEKIKITYLLLGIGIGIILASTLYSFYPKIEYRDLSDDIIIEKARKLGMVGIKESIDVGNYKDKITETNNNLESKEEYIEIVVEKGDNLIDIANNLFKLGLIDNIDEFILLAEDKMVDKNFIYGTYRIKFNTSYSTIINILTTNND